MSELSELSDLVSESGVVGTLIVHPEYVDNSDILEPNHFYDPLNGAYYWAIRELFMDGVTNVDAYSLSVKFNGNDSMKRIVEEHNASIEESVGLYVMVARDSIQDYLMLAKNVISFSYKRELVQCLHRLDNHVFRKKNEELLILNNYVTNEIDEIAAKYQTTGRVQRFGKKVDDLMDLIESRRNGDGTVGIPPKIDALSKYVSYRNKELAMIAGRPKRGKSIYLMNEGIDKAKAGIPVLYIDTEMSDESFLLRAISYLTGIDIYKVETGQFKGNESDLVQEAVSFLKEAPLFHEYDPLITTDKLYALCKSLKRSDNIGFVIYDYLKFDGDDTQANYNALGKMTNALKNDIAGRLDLPVLSAVQLNRNNDIADSDKISRYASAIVMLDRKSGDMIEKDGVECGNYIMKVMFNRNGKMSDMDDPQDCIDLFLNASKMNYQEAKQHDAAPDF